MRVGTGTALRIGTRTALRLAAKGARVAVAARSAEALEEALESFDGTVIAVTHDRWFARSFDRYLVFGADGRVYPSDDPVFDEERVRR